VIQRERTTPLEILSKIQEASKKLYSLTALLVSVVLVVREAVEGGQRDQFHLIAPCSLSGSPI